MKERITITVDDNLLKEVDNMVDEHSIKNRSHAIELLIGKSLRKNILSKAILLAGGTTVMGLGKSRTSVCSTKVNERYVIEHIMFSLKKNNISEFVIVGTKKVLDKIKEIIAVSRLDENIDYIEEPEMMGTAGALRLASEHITGPVVVCNTNSLFQIDLEEMFNTHKNSDSLATIALTTSSTPQKFGVVLMNGTKVYSFEEKPRRKVPSSLINAGCYIMEPEVLKLIPEGFSRVEIDLFPKLANKEKLAGFIFYGKWNYINDNDTLEQAQKEW
jgi:mannose-1-phosphate guanylyltransferase